MKCSCHMYERYGYPCHHLFHVLSCNSIHNIQKEWIDVRWTKSYLLTYLHKDTTSETNNLYSKLKDSFPKGIKFHSIPNSKYPVYKGFDSGSIDDRIFNEPKFQFMSQKTKSLWIECNKSDNIELNKLLSQKDDNYISQQIHLSQEQDTLLETNTFQPNNDSDINEEDSIGASGYNDNEVMDYTDNFALFKRAFQLAGNNTEKHRKLYSMLSEFVIENEINHKDNDEVILNRKGNNDITVSYNKVVNTTKRSTKRKKACWES